MSFAFNLCQNIYQVLLHCTKKFLYLVTSYFSLYNHQVHLLVFKYLERKFFLFVERWPWPFKWKYSYCTCSLMVFKICSKIVVRNIIFIIMQIMMHLFNFFNPSFWTALLIIYELKDFSKGIT